MARGDAIAARLSQPGYGSLRDWVSSLAPGQSRIQSPYCVLRFCRHEGKLPDELVKWQESCLVASEKQEKKRVLRLLQTYLEGVDGTYKYKMREFSAVKSFLDYNDAPLSVDKHFHVRGTRPQVIGTLNVEDVRALVTDRELRKDHRMRSMILVQIQSFSGIGELEYINLTCGDAIVKQLQANTHPIRIDMLRIRKTNEKPWYTFIGSEASDALRIYFEKERGWPQPGEAVWLDTDGGPVDRFSYQEHWRSLCRHLKLIPKRKGGRGTRYGKNPHEIRDLARSLVHKAHTAEHEINGQKLLFDALCPEFWMGHTIDPNQYNKFWKIDPDSVRDQYLIAERYLNVLTTPTVAGLEEQNVKLEEQKEELQILKERVDALARIGTLQTAALEAGGGMAKLLKEAEKAGYVKITHDKIETTKLFEDKMNREAGASVTRADQTRRRRRTRETPH